MFVKLRVHCYSVLLLTSYKLHCWGPNQVLLNAEEHNISENQAIYYNTYTVCKECTNLCVCFNMSSTKSRYSGTSVFQQKIRAKNASEFEQNLGV